MRKQSSAISNVALNAAQTVLGEGLFSGQGLDVAVKAKTKKTGLFPGVE
jgi:hypothetical protein